MTEVFIHGLGQGPESWAGVLSRLPAGGEAVYYYMISIE